MALTRARVISSSPAFRKKIEDVIRVVLTRPRDAASTAGDVADMRRAIALAELGLGSTSPNPIVGCVIVGSDGSVVGEGYHSRAGGPHAEVMALRDAGEARPPGCRVAGALPGAARLRNRAGCPIRRSASERQGGAVPLGRRREPGVRCYFYPPNPTNNICI